MNASSRSVVHMRPSTTATDQKNQDRRQLPVLQYPQHQLDGSLVDGDVTHMQYPTAISQPLNFRIVAIGEATATIELEADAVLHGSPQGTVHGGLLCELADAAIGTAHSTSMHAGESFTSIELKATFLRPVWAPGYAPTPGPSTGARRSATTGATSRAPTARSWLASAVS